MTIADADQRRQALDTACSFCVTAPAGSGKTELLIQRYLALLARVARPEQVLAITFTRKAAAEMRERVLQALDGAARATPLDGDHARTTRQLAVDALAKSDALDWQLRRDISRLNIKTIDSFCAGLVRQLPVMSQFGGSANVVENTEPLYREAVNDLFDLLGSDESVAHDLEALLLHFDNNWDRVSTLLCAMLARRDQWSDYMGARHSPRESEAALLETVHAVVAEALAGIHRRLQPYRERLRDLLRYSLEQLGEPVPIDFPLPRPDTLSQWSALRRMLLTNQGGWRKRLDKSIGFVTGGGTPAERKAQLKELLAELAEQPGLAEELDAVAWLPETHSHTESWQLVLHLSHLLPVLAACLLLVFQRRGVVDHSQVALSALDALGDDEAPTELALRLDYRIEHILVDEFQDTAIGQYKLVSRLTRGWAEHNEANPGAPRTIFIVGDGMQSIYGFRDANVGLFLKAREEGFNGVVPQALALSCNFRSDAGIVDWINRAFLEAFPVEDDVRRGQVSFTPAVAVRPAFDAVAVTCHAFVGEGAALAEADFIAGDIRTVLAGSSQETIAVLGRSRAQLTPVLAALRSAGIAYAAQDMDALSGAQAVADLMSLCRALANPADRVAAFALLRAPWLGLSLADLHLLATASTNPSYAGLQQLLSLAGTAGLSRPGQRLIRHLGQVWQWANAHRDRLDLRVWVEQVWLLLDGPATVANPLELADAVRFFELLQEAQLAGVGLDIPWLEQQLERLYAAGTQPDARVQVMTLHKAKGLEFDTVYIPALARSTRGSNRDLLLWDEYNGPDGQRGFLLAAEDHSDDSQPTLYNYLRRSRKRKSILETTRLLYVGATRAIGRLVLSTPLGGELDDSGEVCSHAEPGEASLLAPLWSVFENEMRLHAVPSADDEGSAAPGHYQRLHQDRPLPEVPSPPVAEGANIPERVLNREDRLVGTVVHLALEALAQEKPLPAGLPADARIRCQLALAEGGLAGPALARASSRVVADLETTLADTEGGRWILDAGHPQSATELPMTYVDAAGVIRDIVIDRTFIDPVSGERWIVDYKTSAPQPGEPVAAFLAREEAHYREQLETYRDCLRQLGPQALRCGLYFTALGLFHELQELALAAQGETRT